MSVTIEMTSFGIDLVKDHKSVLNMMSFIFLNYEEYSTNKHVPENLQKLLIALPFYAKNFFTDNIGNALGFLMKSKFTTDEIAGGICSATFFFRESKLWKTYQSREFLYFCACYIPKAVKQYYSLDNFKPTTEVYDAIIRIIRRNRQKALLNDESWKTLDEISSRIIMVETIHKEELEKIMTSLTRVKLLKNSLDLVDEQQFLLEMMKYISNFFFKSVLNWIDRVYAKIPNKRNSHFTPAIKKATLIILNNRIRIFEKIKDEGVGQFDQWLSRLVISFHARDFLECCVCLTHNHIREYFEEDKFHSPAQAYQALLYIFKQNKVAGMFTTLSWKILEKVALQIISENKKRATESFDILIKVENSAPRKIPNFENVDESSSICETGSQIHIIQNLTSEEGFKCKYCCIIC